MNNYLDEPAQNIYNKESIIYKGDKKMNFLTMFLAGSVTFNGGEEAAAAAQEAAAQAATTATTAANPQGGAMSGIIMVAYIIVIFVLMYLFAIKPQKKREQQLKDIQNDIKEGDWIVTSSGFYGKVCEIYDQNVIVEFGLNKGIRIPILKSEIYGNTEPNLTNKPAEEASGK